MASQLITVSSSESPRRFKIVRIDYLSGITPRLFVRVLQQQANNLIGEEPVVVVTNDGAPCIWACAILLAFCSRAAMVAVDMRDGAEKSCIVVVSRSRKWRLGERIPNPDPDGNGMRHTGVAKKS